MTAGPAFPGVVNFSETILKKYILQLAVTILLLGGMVICFNWIVDPFDVYRVVRKEGFNAYKVSYEHFARLAKVIQVEKYPKPGLALGSSRAQLGIDMSHPLWDGRGGWNLAVNGANMYEIRRLLEHAAAVSKLEKVVIGVDFYMFNIYAFKGFGDESHFFADQNGHRNPWHRIRQNVLALCTGSAFFAGIKTLRKQDPMDNNFSQDGRMLTDRERMKVIQDGGFNKKFTKIERVFASGGWTPCANRAFCYGAPSGLNMLDEFRKTIDLAVREKIKLYVVISPIHARLMETLYGVGLGAEFEQWKRDMTRIVDQANSRGGDAPVELWDFSGCSVYSTEAVPTDSERNKLMRWYVDPSHYSVELGNIMLDRLLGKKSQSVFGNRLSASSIEAVLEEQRSAREEFRHRNPVLINLIKNNIFQYGQKREKRCEGN